MEMLRGALLSAAFALLVGLGCGDDGGSPGPDGGPGGDSGPGDTTAPSVVSVSPADGATSVDHGVAIEIVWDEALDPATVTASTFGLAPSAYDDIAYDDSTFTVTLTTSSGYHAGSLYQLSISGVADPAGNVAADFTSSFSVAAAAVGRIDDGGAATHEGAVMAFDDDGNGVAAWLINRSRREGNGESIAVSFYTAATSSWSAETVYDRNARELFLASNGETFMLVDDRGEARLITFDGSDWTLGSAVETEPSSVDGLLTNGTSYAIWDRSRINVGIYDGSWTSYNVGTSPDTMATDGNTYAIAWADGSDLLLSLFLDGSWTTATTVDDDTDTVRSPTLVGDYDGGGFLIAWEQDQTGSSTISDDIWTAYFTYTGTTVTEASAAAVVVESERVAVAVANATGFFLAWEAGIGTVGAATSTDGSSWSTETIYEGVRVLRGTVMAADHGRVIVGIHDIGGADDSVHAVVHNGTSWASATQLSTAGGLKSDLSAAAFVDATTAANNRLGLTWLNEGAPSRVMLATYSTSFTTAAVDSATWQTGSPGLAGRGGEISIAWGQDDGLWTWVADTSVGIVTSSYDAMVVHSQLAVSDSGTRVAAWVQPVGWAEMVHARVAAGAGWDDIVPLSGTVPLGQVDSLGLASSGETAMAAWNTRDGLSTAFYDGSSWQAPAVHDADGTGDVVLFADAGGYTMVWHRSIDAEEGGARATGSGASAAAGDAEIVLQTYAGGSWGTESTLEITEEIDDLGAVAGAAGVAVYWTSDSGSELSAAVHSGGVWSSPQVLDASFDSAHSTQIAVSDDGFGFMWRSGNDHYFVEATGTSFGSHETLTTTGETDGRLWAASDGTGFLAVWVDLDGTLYRAEQDGSSWGAPVALPAGAAWIDATVVGSSGGYLVAVHQDDDDLVATVKDGGSWTDTTIDSGVELRGGASTAGVHLLGVKRDNTGGGHDLELISYDGAWQSPLMVTTQDPGRFDSLLVRPAPGRSTALAWEVDPFLEQLWGTPGVAY